MFTPVPASAHETPQEPQLFGSVVVFTQTPPHKSGSSALLAHEAMHIEPLQTVVPPSGAAGHVAPHEPQLAASVMRFTHVFVSGHRSGNDELLHAATHVAPLHAVPPFVGAVGHDAHVLLQFILPTGQALHTLPLHPAGHTWPHEPQFVALVDVFTSQPFAPASSQFANGAVHAGLEHTEDAHVSVPPLWLQARPQPPQLAALVLVLISQPLAAL
jgi:hypothetical protein